MGRIRAERRWLRQLQPRLYEKMARHFIAYAGRAAREDGGRLFVVALSPCARRIIGLTGLQAVLGERDVRAKHAA